VGAAADAVVTTATDRVLAVHTADCVPVALVAPDGRDGPVIAAVHAGWRGLAEGVVESAMDAMRSRGAGEVAAYVGPCISAGAYEFGSDDLGVVAARYGDEVRGTTDGGRPALDLRAGVRAAVERHGGRVERVSDRCTAARPDELYSHRARQDAGRQALLVWIDEGER
jgi:copper oxidase (laccase) domain-containing protein